MKYDNQISELRNLLEALESLSKLPEPAGAPLMEVVFEMVKSLCEKVLEPGEVPVETTKPVVRDQGCMRLFVRHVDNGHDILRIVELLREISMIAVRIEPLFSEHVARRGDVHAARDLMEAIISHKLENLHLPFVLDSRAASIYSAKLAKEGITTEIVPS